MLRFIVIRLLGVLPQLVLVSLLAFLIMKAAPGDPVASLAGGTERITAADHARVSHNLGLDRPILVQYASWLSEMVRGNWGHALKDGRSVFDIVLFCLTNTLLLVACVWVITIVLGVLLGYLAGSRPNSAIDYVISSFSTLSLAIPPFWLGLVCILVFAVWLGLLPTSGSEPIGGASSVAERLSYLVLPVVTVVLTHVGPYVRLVRSNVRDTLSSGFIRAARARGLHGSTIVLRYLLPNALAPFITWAGFSLPLLISGIFVVEWVFAWPGLGREFLRAATTREYPIMMGCVIVVCVLVIIGNLLADCLVAAINPKLRRAHGN